MCRIGGSQGWWVAKMCSATDQEPLIEPTLKLWFKLGKKNTSDCT